jgi:hypothetical protein
MPTFSKRTKARALRRTAASIVAARGKMARGGGLRKAGAAAAAHEVSLRPAAIEPYKEKKALWHR